MIEYYEAFLDYFMGLGLSGQIITGILIIMALIAVGYIIYGCIWITYQSIKFSIVLTVIIIYLHIALITICISVIANKENIGNLWSKASYDIQKIISDAYNFNKSQTGQVKQVEKNVPTQSPPVIIIEKQKTSEIPTPQSGNLDSVGENDSAIIPKYTTKYDNSENEQNMVENSKNPLNKQEFCPNCGNKFTQKMIDVLNEGPFTFCELCGEKFYKRDENQVIST